tara:strand:- start:405 stop:668 length:264 start_codon:yes stop_codon:yes gene_type:complete
MLNTNENCHDEFIVINLDHKTHNSNTNENKIDTPEHNNNYNNNNIINQQPIAINKIDNRPNNTLPRSNKKNSATYGFINLMKLCFDI